MTSDKPVLGASVGHKLRLSVIVIAGVKLVCRPDPCKRDVTCIQKHPESYEIYDE